MKTERALHVLRRARERYDLYLPDSAIDVIAKAIQGQTAEYVRTKSNRVTVWNVAYEGNELTVFYDKIHGMPVTIIRRKPTKAPNP